MAEIKRSINVPPLGLQKAVLRLSKSQSWNEAKREWQAINYYYVNKYFTCPCSPRGIHNVTILINKLNSNELVVCNSCAKRHWKYNDGSLIENSVRRLKKDMTASMNETSLDYLLKNRVIDAVEHYNYLKIKRFRECDGKGNFVFKYKEETNIKLIHYTDYNNKIIFDKIDQILIWALTHPSIDIRYVANIWKDLLQKNQCIEYQLNDFIRFNEIEESLGDKMKARKLFDKFIETTCICENRERWPFVMYRWKNAEEYIKNKHRYAHVKFSELQVELKTMYDKHLNAMFKIAEQNPEAYPCKTWSDSRKLEMDYDRDNIITSENTEKNILSKFSDERLNELEIFDEKDSYNKKSDIDNENDFTNAWDDVYDNQNKVKKVLPEFSDKWLDGLEDYIEEEPCEDEEDDENYLGDFDYLTPTLSVLKRTILQKISSFVFKYAKGTDFGIFIGMVLHYRTLCTKVSTEEELNRFLEKASFEGLRDGLINLITYSNPLRRKFLMEELNKILIIDGMEVTEDQWGEVRMKTRKQSF